MRNSELIKVDGELQNRYVETFGMFDTACAPDVTADKLESLMKEALDTGAPIPYAKAGWWIPPANIVV